MRIAALLQSWLKLHRSRKFSRGKHFGKRVDEIDPEHSGTQVELLPLRDVNLCHCRGGKAVQTWQRGDLLRGRVDAICKFD
ncbi:MULTISPECIES: hypothetical protein [unclassified Bradyrhizobium]|uniref:hypothetical protein n=1 Tax=unclassified Bradyrhizobium TaxID=2631580 RepID=UPI002916E15B|nr:MULTISPECIES: hypothetical protein [unclassified Bradyrhizobium]